MMGNRNDGLAIWQAGVDAVRSDTLVQRHLRCGEGHVAVGPAEKELQISLTADSRIMVVGAGKAGAGMVAGTESVLAANFGGRLSGWVNVPADCVQPTEHIQLHPARPAGRNEPTSAGVAGSAEILARVTSLGPSDLCICLISGGGSALLPALRHGVTLDDLLHVTKTLSAAGATIQQLNALRKRLSTIQGGQLAQACSAKHLVSLIISDVMGDPLSFIASGPTFVEDAEPAIRAALATFDEFDLADRGVRPELRRLIADQLTQDSTTTSKPKPTTPQVTNLIIGNNQSAVLAAQSHAESLGYDVTIDEQQAAAETAESVGQRLAEQLATLRPKARQRGRKQCLISGGEPVVALAPAATRGLGGRNQQLVLAALATLLEQDPTGDALDDAVLVSGGTDGEDGPTDAAGGVIDREVVAAAIAQELDVNDYLLRNDAYRFLDQTAGLIRTGPTHTNVCDLRVLVVPY